MVPDRRDAGDEASFPGADRCCPRRNRAGEVQAETTGEAISDLRAIVLYDNDCGFCRWSLKWVRAWDRPGGLQYLPIQSTSGEDLLEEVPEELWLASWHLALPDGNVLSGGRAVAPLLRLLPRGRYLARVFELFPGLTDRGYEFVAGHRSQLGKLVRRFGSVPPQPPTR